MTREEAIKVLEAEKKFLFHGSLSDKHYELAFDMAIESLKAQQWIPCSERLPEYADFYLTSTEYDSVYCDFYDGYEFQRTEKIIAWMPLPDPYGEKR